MSARGAGGRTVSGEALGALLLTELSTLAEAAAAVDAGGVGCALVCDASGAPKRVVDDAALRAAWLRGVSTAEPVSRLPLEPVEVLTDGAAAPCGEVAVVVRGGKAAELRIAPPSSPLPSFALVLAGGLGTRMGSLTESTPKPLIPVAGKPLLEHVLAHLSSHGVEEVALATNYRAEQIEAFAGDGSRFGVKIRTIREPQRMGTAGALSLLDPIPKAPFYVVNGDVLTKLHLGALSRHRHRTGAAIAMAVAAHVVESPFGVVRLAGTRVVDLTEKPRLHQWVNAGLYVLEPRVAASVPRSTYVDMTTMIDKWIQRGEPVEAFPIREYWRDAGTPEDLARADKELR